MSDLFISSHFLPTFLPQVERPEKLNEMFYLWKIQNCSKCDKNVVNCAIQIVKNLKNENDLKK